ncbi:MAG: TetR family transcriptional regulator, partial [Planctomycetales bacterium]|nr:TetR family transcriptional regulator [Planctomycetales bacterium]
MSSVNPAPLQRRERKKQNRINRVRDVALQLFVDKGFDSVTVDEIAETADIGRASFFNYFATKDAVLRSYHFWIYDE